MPATFNFADLWELVVDADGIAEREALVCGPHRRTYAELEDHANRFANHLLARGVRPGQHIALYLENCPEYLEAMLGCFKVRAVPINVNYRYVAGELRYLLDDCDAVGVVHAPHHAEVVAQVLPDLAQQPWTLATGDAWDAALAAASPDRPPGDERTGDDRYVLYTGGTTGLPKGVEWRQEDAFYACLGGGDASRLRGEVNEPEEMLDRLNDGMAYMTAAPLIHAAAQWTSFMWFFCGGKVVLLQGSLDPEAVWSTIEAEQVNALTVVGDAVAKPLLDAWDANPGRWDVSCLFAFSNGGAPMSAACKQRVLDRFPSFIVNDGFGSSEAGIQGASRTTAADAAESSGPVRFSTAGQKPLLVLDDDDRPIEPGSGVVGRIVTGGRLPLGYYGDPEKTAATFIEVDGQRWLVTGDLATVAEDGSVDLLGRGSTSINTGGEKVHPEEVEGVLHAHPAVADVLVVGVPDERWGSAVTAVVQPAVGVSVELADLAAHCREQLAGYKVPKHLVVVDKVVRSPAGKADYRWAAETAASSVNGT